jgi:hypothetical protein
MSAAPVSAGRYASLEYQAIYLRAEWADILFPGAHPDVPETPALEPDPLIGTGRPGHFYQRVAAITAAWASGLGLEAQRACDVGGSTGRLLFEFAKRLPDMTELVLAEPSPHSARGRGGFYSPRNSTCGCPCRTAYRGPPIAE